MFPNSRPATFLPLVSLAYQAPFRFLGARTRVSSATSAAGHRGWPGNFGTNIPTLLTSVTILTSL
jgi:hypothetical protein